MEVFYIILGILSYILLTCIVSWLIRSERDDISIINVVIICLFFSPILGLFIGMLSPYKSIEVKTKEKHDPQDNAKIFQSKDPNDKSRYSDGLW